MNTEILKNQVGQSHIGIIQLNYIQLHKIIYYTSLLRILDSKQRTNYHLDSKNKKIYLLPSIAFLEEKKFQNDFYKNILLEFRFKSKNSNEA